MISTPSLVMMEKPGSLTSAAFLVSFLGSRFGFFDTRALRILLGGVRLVEAYVESPNVADETGDGVKVGGLNPAGCDCVGLCSKTGCERTTW